MCRDIGVQMLTFGKGSKVSGRKCLIGRKWFDGLVEVRERVIEEKSAYRHHYMPNPSLFEDFCFAEESKKKTLRENRQLNKTINEQKKRTERSWWWYDTPVVKKNAKKKLGYVYVEADLDGAEKLAHKEARQNRIYSSQNFKMRKRNARSWKSCGKKQVDTWIQSSELTPNDGKFVPIGGARFNASKQWMTKKPTIHKEWTIGDEMSAGYLQREREIEAYNEHIEMLRARVDNQEGAYEEDEVYFAEVRNLDDIEERYWYGRWNVADTDETKKIAWQQAA